MCCERVLLLICPVLCCANQICPGRPPRDGLPGTGLGRRLSDAGQDYSEEALREQLDPYPAIASQTTMGPNQPNPAGEPFHMELGEDRFTYPPDKNAQKLLDDYSSLFKTNRFRPREWPGDIPKQPVYVPNPNPYVIPDEEARMKVSYSSLIIRASRFISSRSSADRDLFFLDHPRVLMHG